MSIDIINKFNKIADTRSVYKIQLCSIKKTKQRENRILKSII